MLATMMTGGAQAQRGPSWESLGCVEVGRRADFDIIEVGKREGAYKAIRLKVTGNDANIEDLRVIYANGQPDRIALRSEFREGTESQMIDLKGQNRFIQRIELVSRRGYKGRGRGRAQICVFGLEAGRPGLSRPARADWEQLGCQKVGFIRDRDVIKVGRRDGRFKAIRLEVTGNDIRVDNLTVIYGNGEPDRISFGDTIRENTRTRPLDLKGRDRFIREIQMVYKSKPNFQGSARVCVSGLQN